MLKRLLPHILVFFVCGIAFLLGALDPLDDRLMDLRFRLDRHEASGKFVLVEINESSLQRFNRWPWPRDMHATVIRRLLAAKAAQIALDIDFSLHSTESADKELATALQEAGSRVVLPAFQQHELQGDGTFRAIDTLPAQDFMQGPRVALVNVIPEASGIVRRMREFDALGGRQFQSLASLLSGDERFKDYGFYIDYGIDPATIPRISYADVLEGRFDPSIVAGKIVLVGASAIELGDMLSVPLYRTLPGPTVQALAYESLVQNRAFGTLGAIPVLIVALLIAIFGGPRLVLLSWRPGLATTVAASFALTVAGYALQSTAALYPSSALWVCTVVGLYLAGLVGRIDQQDVILLIQKLAIRKRAAFMKMVVENSFDAIFTLSTDQSIRTANHSAEAMFGWRADEMVGTRLETLFFGDSADAESRAGLSEALSGPGIHQIAGVNRAGEILHLDLAVSQMQVDGEVTLIVIARDVTARRLAEKVARKALNQLRDSIETIPEGFAMFGPDDRLILWNTRYRELNTSGGEPLDHSWSYARIQSALVKAGFYPESAGQEEAWLAARMKMHGSTDRPIVDLTRNGRWILSNEHKVADNCVIVVQTDISDLKRRENEMSDLVNKFAQVAAGVAATTTGIVITDALIDNGPIVFVNPAFTAMTGYSENESLGRSIDLLYGPDTDASCRGAIAEAMADGRASRGIMRNYRKNRDVFWNEFNVNPVRDENQVVTYYVWVVDDVTDRISTEQALVDAKTVAEISNRSKSEFLHNMSHELRTPLNAIIGFSEVMQMQTFGPIGDPHYIEYANGIHESGQHLLSVINDVLDISKIESGRFELVEEEVSLASVFDSVANLIQVRAENAKVEFIVVDSKNLPSIRADKRIIKQMLLNVLDNAVKFTPERGKVGLRAICDPKTGIRIMVADNGIGIAPDHIAKVMEPFGQVDSSLSRKYNGTGLGLPLAKRFIEMHGGTLTLESRENIGTKVTLWFPPKRLVLDPRITRISTGQLAS